MRPNPVLFTATFILGYALTIDVAAVVSDRATGAMAGEAAPARSWVTEQNDAVLLARRGDTAAALVVLERLHREHPEDLGVARDFVAVSAWAGRGAEAIRLFAALPTSPQPDYVIEAVAAAYRHLGQATEALALYRQGLNQSPDNVLFAAGVIRSLADLGQFAPAIVSAEADLRTHGERVDVLLAAGYAASAQKKPVEALRYIDRAMTLDPAGREAKHDRIMAIDEMGAPQIARQLADENPGVLAAAELRQIDGDAAAALVRWGVLEPPNEQQRFAASDRAIAALDALIAQWSKEGAAAQRDVLRARFDRMVALRDRVRMADVLAEYEDLKRQGVVIPGYALVAAADAYLYFRQPETARDLYLRGLAVDPHNPDTRLALFYAYVDLDDFDAAYRQVDTAAADQSIWLYLKGLNDPIENPERATADLAAADARLYADELAEANRRVAAMAEAAPNNTRYLSALANIYSARGWPRLAAEEYEISRALKPQNVTTEVGQALNNLDLRDYRDVEAELADLERRFPENLEVQRLDRLWQVHNMAEFRLEVEPTFTSATNVQGGSGVAVDAQLFSPPIDYNWRIFADEYVAHELLPEGEGAITLRRSAVGAEYSGRDMVASLEGTVSAFGPQVDTTLESGIDRGRGGARALATWSVNDYWEIGGGAELFSRDTPLRALASGVTANSASTDVVYRESESREFRLDGEAMDFSDGNVRTSLAGKYEQRLLTQPHFTVDGIIDLAESHDSADANRLYYNPRQDALATVGISINQEIYRRYELIYDHHLVVTPGAYWEQGFGTGGAASVLYEQRVRSNDVLEASLGVNFSRQPYDGDYQNTLAILFNLRLRL
jgi:biofilm PGA synthesis protein PgaA